MENKKLAAKYEDRDKLINWPDGTKSSYIPYHEQS